MPATLQSLSRETLRNIFIHFCEHYDLNEEALDQAFPTLSDPLNQHTLFSLCLVSRSFHDVAQVLLYRRFLSRDGRKEPNDRQDIILERLIAQLGSFLRTVTERPDLAALVKGVTCNAYYSIFDPTSTHPWKTIPSIVNKLPNIEQYSVDFRGALPPHVEYMLGLRGLPFSNVSEYYSNLLKCDANGETGQVISVPILNLRMSNADHQSIGFETATSPKLRIETLRVVDSRTDRRTLDAILSRCTDLKRFIHQARQPEQGYRFRGEPSHHPQFDQLDASQALAAHKDSLETLHLDISHRVFAQQPRAGSSLASFIALQSLLVDSFFVCNKRDDPSAKPQRLVEMLPPNLVSLELVGCPGKALSVFAQMFLVLIDGIREGRFQALKRIEYNASNVPVPGADTCFDDLGVAEKFAELEVAFTYSRPPFDDSELATSSDRAWEFGWVEFIDFSCICHYEPCRVSSTMPLPDEDEDDDL